jgi:hypothetical protein
MEQKDQSNALYGYYLHFNPYTGYWNAVKRDKANEYLNGTLGADDVLKNKDVMNLIKYLSKNG